LSVALLGPLAFADWNPPQSIFNGEIEIMHA
jgi:hypothetical protein